MAFKLNGRIGMPDLTTIDTTAQMPLGSRVVGTDPTFGDGEFIYCKGVASTVVGDVVVFDENYQTVRAVSASRGAVGVAMAALVASTFGWYQVSGLATVNVLAAFAADLPVYLTATAGSVDDAVVAAQKIDGMDSQSAVGTPAANQAYIYMAPGASANGNG